MGTINFIFYETIKINLTKFFDFKKFNWKDAFVKLHL